MSSLRRDLFTRRRWPLAALLLAAIAAVPLMLHRASAHAAPVPAAPSPAAIVAARGEAVVVRRGTRHRTAVSLRDPFASGLPARTSSSAAGRGSRAATNTTTSSPTTTTATSAATVTPSPSAGASSTASTPSASAPSTGPTPPATAPVSPAPTNSHTTPSTPSSVARSKPAHRPTAKTTARLTRRSWTIYSVDARIGAPGHASARRDLARLAPLPSAAAPFVMFTGVIAGGHAAVFSLGAGVAARGPGLCRPSHAHCIAIVLGARRTERLAVPTASGGHRTVALKVSRIARRVTHSPTVALRAFRRVSRDGQCELGLANPLTYDAASGLLSRVPAGTCRHVKSPVAFPGSVS